MVVYQWVMIIYFSLLFLFGCIGNAVLLAVFWKNRNYSSVIVFIKALALTDFYVCFTKPIVVIYWALHEYKLDETFCKLFQFTIGTGYVLTFCIIFLVAMDRYLAIYHTEGSLFSVTVQHANILVVVVWILCHAGNLLKVFFGTYLQVENDKYFCAEEADESVITYMFLAFVFVLCCIVVLWINFQIVQAVKRQSQTTPALRNIPTIGKPVQDTTSSEALTNNGDDDHHRQDDEKRQMAVVEVDEANRSPPKEDQKDCNPTKPSNKTVTRSRSQNRSKPKRAKQSKVITSLTKMLAVVTLVYVATSLPTIIIFFVPLQAEFDIAENMPFFYTIYLLLKYLFFVDSVIKPFIYYAVSRTFREQVRDFLTQLGV